jgi:hypothetical protein
MQPTAGDFGLPIAIADEEEEVQLPQRLAPSHSKRRSRKTHRMGSSSEGEEQEETIADAAATVKNWGEFEDEEQTQEMDQQTALDNKIKKLTAGLRGKGEWKKIIRKLYNDAELEYTATDSKANQIAKLARKYILG